MSRKNTTVSGSTTSNTFTNSCLRLIGLLKVPACWRRMKEWWQKEGEEMERMSQMKETRMLDIEMVREDAVYD
jgi:hypothetical protein